MYKHAVSLLYYVQASVCAKPATQMFNEAKTDCAGPLCSVGDQEYRRNSWQFTPVASDIRNGVVDIPQAWGDYGGKSPPWTMVPKVCGMSMP